MDMAWRKCVAGMVALVCALAGTCAQAPRIPFPRGTMEGRYGRRGFQRRQRGTRVGFAHARGRCRDLGRGGGTRFVAHLARL